jgi:hypothetical protein
MITDQDFLQATPQSYKAGFRSAYLQRTTHSCTIDQEQQNGHILPELQVLNIVTTHL